MSNYKKNNKEDSADNYATMIMEDENWEKKYRQKRRENKIKNKNKQKRNDYRWN